MSTKPEDCLRRALATMEERVRIHGGSHTYKKFGPVMSALFPDGIDAIGDEDFNKLGIFMMMVHKMCRLSNDLFSERPNTENPHDLGNYSFIMESLIRDVERPLFLRDEE